MHPPTTPVWRQLDSRDQARRLPAYGAPGPGRHPLDHPQGQRLDAALSARGGGRESLKVRSCLIDGEVVRFDDRGLAVFQALRRRQNEERPVLYSMPLKLRPTGLGSGIDKDRPDCTAAAGMLVASAVLLCASRSQGHELIRRLECQGQ